MSLYVFIIIMLLPAAALAACYDPILSEAFDRADTNYDGKVDVEESIAYFDQYDQNGDKNITLAEVKNTSSVVQPGIQGREETFFAIFDLNKDGVLDADDVVAIFYVADKDKDGFLTKTEVQAALNC